MPSASGLNVPASHEHFGKHQIDSTITRDCNCKSSKCSDDIRICKLLEHIAISPNITVHSDTISGGHSADEFNMHFEDAK